MASLRTGGRALVWCLTVTSLVALASAYGTGSPPASSAAAGRVIEIASDLPLDGDVKASSEETNKALRLYLDQIRGKAGPYTVRLKIYNNATSARGGWDDETCVKNAVGHLRSAEVAVMGTYNSGCARLMVPVMNQASNGPLLMVSHANTNPGLTKPWGPNEPQKFAPTGTRSFARVAATDDQQGAAGAGFIKHTLGASRCFVLNDGQLYGLGVAKAFATAAAQLGVTVLGNRSWDVGADSYVDLFQQVAAAQPDCVYLAGVFENHGAELIRDKVAVLGDNSKVALIGPDGFSGYAELDAMPQGAGMYLTFIGLSLEEIVKQSPTAGTFITAYQQRYGSPPTSSYALYGVAALQVILAAVESSDGTRRGVERAVFGSANLTVPAASSITGQDITIDHTTGDALTTTLTVLQIRGGVESFVSSQTVS